MKEGLEKLPYKYRDEGADVLGLEVSTLKSRLFRARLMLRDKLSSHFPSIAVTLVS